MVRQSAVLALAQDVAEGSRRHSSAVEMEHQACVLALVFAVDLVVAGQRLAAAARGMHRTLTLVVVNNSVLSYAGELGLLLGEEAASRIHSDLGV